MTSKSIRYDVKNEEKTLGIKWQKEKKAKMSNKIFECGKENGRIEN